MRHLKLAVFFSVMLFASYAGWHFISEKGVFGSIAQAKLAAAVWVPLLVGAVLLLMTGGAKVHDDDYDDMRRRKQKAEEQEDYYAMREESNIFGGFEGLDHDSRD